MPGDHGARKFQICPELCVRKFWSNRSTNCDLLARTTGSTARATPCSSSLAVMIERDTPVTARDLIWVGKSRTPRSYAINVLVSIKTATDHALEFGPRRGEPHRCRGQKHQPLRASDEEDCGRVLQRFPDLGQPLPDESRQLACPHPAVRSFRTHARRDPIAIGYARGNPRWKESSAYLDYTLRPAPLKSQRIADADGKFAREDSIDHPVATSARQQWGSAGTSPGVKAPQLQPC
jgi:hypothetical protein